MFFSITILLLVQKLKQPSGTGTQDDPHGFLAQHISP